jgi:L-malate glycosyltransferase
MSSPPRAARASPARDSGPLVHFMHSLEVGGLERVVLELARRARSEGLDHRLLICDRPFEPGGRDFDPGEIPCTFLPRGAGLDLAFARKLRAFFAEQQVALVHAHNDTPIAYAALAGVPRSARVPACVGTFHTLPSHGGVAARLLSRWACGRMQALSVVSRELGERLAASGWSRTAQVIENGVDLDVFEPADPGTRRGEWRRRLGISDEMFFVGCLARYVPGKRQADLLEAARRLRLAGASICVVFAGQGPERNALRARASGDAHVHVLDPIADVAGFLRELDAFVLCSDHEAHPRAVLEAMACGVPCVLTAVGGMPELCGTRQGAPAALLVPARDPQALAGALETLIRDSRARTELGARARARAADFASDVPWATYRALWASATSRRSSGS